jgi:putative ABC transport system permease protein
VSRFVSWAGGSFVIGANVVSEALASLQGRRMQVALSSFGIATGIAAVVLLVSIVSGLHHYLAQTIGIVGGNVIRVSVSQQRSTRDPQGFPLTLRTSDMDAVLQAVNDYDLGLAENAGNGIVRTPHRSSQGAQVRGLTDHGFEMLGLHTERGRLFLDAEYAAGARVAILGADLAMDLFAQDSPIGQSIVIGDWPFLVVGVLDWVGDVAAGALAPPDRQIFVPFKACAAAFRGHENASTLNLRLKSADAAPEAIAATKAVLEPLRRQRGETSGEFQVVSSIERLEELNLVLTTMKLVVGLVGSIGLFVGAVGIANVLLVSVRERRQEIGVRRAVGATRRAVFYGFLFEALVMTLSGGIVGIIVAWGLTKIAIFIPQVPVDARPQVSVVTALTALSLLTLVGLIAGVWPARRAAAVFPSEALRAD